MTPPRGRILAAGVLVAARGRRARRRPAQPSPTRRAGASEVPARVERVYAAGGPASILLYTLAPEKMLGWTRALGPGGAAFVPARYADLPTLGRLTGRGNTANVEVVLAARPDVILDYGSLTATYGRSPTACSSRPACPTALRREPLRHPGCLRARGRPARRGRTAAASSAGTRSACSPRPTGAWRACPPRSGPRVYYARGPKGLDTAARGSINVESLDRLGARNVADKLGVRRLGRRLPGAGAGLGSRRSSWRSIRPSWRRSAPIPCGRACARCGKGACTWSRRRPFPWVDFPPSVNRLIGL